MSEPGRGQPMDGRTIVVAGATGGVGEGAVGALLHRGSTVIAVGRGLERLHELGSRFDASTKARFVPLRTDVTAADSDAVRAEVLAAAGGTVDGVLIAIGSSGRPAEGTLLDIPDPDVQEMIAVNEVGGLRALRALVPCVRLHGAVVNLLGYSAEVPFPANPLMGSTNAALRSMLTTLAVQLSPVTRVYALVLGVVRTRARQAAGNDNPRWLTGEQVGDYTADLVLGNVDRPDQALRYFLDPAAGPQLSPPATSP